MDERNALAIGAALGEAAFETVLRGVAMVLATLTLLGMLMGMAFVSSVIEASESAALPDEDQILLI